MSVARSILVGLAVSQVAVLATTVYLHRCLAHRAVKLHPAVAMLFRSYLWITTGLRGRDWAALHRKHHRFTDKPGDPHSPVLLGFWKVQLGNAFLYRNALKHEDMVAKYAPELKPDRWDRWFFDRAWIGLPVGIALSVLIGGGLVPGAIISVVHVVSYIVLNSAINAIGHSAGYKRFDNTAYNNRIFAFFTGGEGLHNNHHGRPASATMAASRFEKVFDTGWHVLRVLELCKLATLRRPKEGDESGTRLRRRLGDLSAAAGA